MPSPFPSHIPEAPGWIENAAQEVVGLDLLGLRVSVQEISARLLSGVTTVTPLVRYLSLRTWLLDCYRRQEGGFLDSRAEFNRFARCGEVAFVAANLLHDRATVGLIGHDWVLAQLDGGAAEITPLAWEGMQAANVYAGASNGLGLTIDRKDAAPLLTDTRGLPLAQAVAPTFTATRLGQRLARGKPLDSFAVDEAREFGAVAAAGQVGEAERNALTNAMVPDEPLEWEFDRIASYALLLELARLDVEPPTEERAFREAIRGPERVAPVLAGVLDRWLRYLVRDMIAVAGEAAFQGDVEALGRITDPAGAEEGAVVRMLLAETDAFDGALRELRLLGPDESVEALRFSDLERRVRYRLGLGETPPVPRLRRWAADLDELPVIDRAKGRGARAVPLMVVAWLIAEFRAAGVVQEDPRADGDLSYHGSERFGVRQVILPALERWRVENPRLPDLFAEIAFRAADQHLRIAFARLAVQRRNDVAVILRDGTRWVYRKPYTGGRYESRLPYAIGWLRQLGLIGPTGLTLAGEALRERALRLVAWAA